MGASQSQGASWNSAPQIGVCPPITWGSFADSESEVGVRWDSAFLMLSHGKLWSVDRTLSREGMKAPTPSFTEDLD